MRGQLVTFAFTVVAALFACSVARAERVGYSFTGTLNVPLGGTQAWFGMPYTSAQPLTGTFSYDSTADGVDVDPTRRMFHQSISGGYSLDVDFGSSNVVVESSDYDVWVANDFGSPATDQFIINYFYDSANNITPKKVLVNDAEWTGPFVKMLLSLIWDAGTFDGPNEPELTANRPSTPNPGFFASAGDRNPAPFISNVQISAIVPKAGDYNRDGKINSNDYAEWRKAVGRTEPEYSYADGNHDGVIGAADYVVWRKTPGGALGLASIPEPGGLTLFVTWIVLFGWSEKRWHRDALQR